MRLAILFSLVAIFHAVVFIVEDRDFDNITIAMLLFSCAAAQMAIREHRKALSISGGRPL